MPGTGPIDSGLKWIIEIDIVKVSKEDEPKVKEKLDIFLKKVTDMGKHANALGLANLLVEIRGPVDEDEYPVIDNEVRKFMNDVRAMKKTVTWSDSTKGPA
jgi:hypothetical protein